MDSVYEAAVMTEIMHQRPPRPAGEEMDKLYQQYMEGMTDRQIAERYGVSRSTVRSWMFHYRKKLRSLEAFGPECVRMLRNMADEQPNFDRAYACNLCMKKVAGLLSDYGVEVEV